MEKSTVTSKAKHGSSIEQHCCTRKKTIEQCGILQTDDFHISKFISLKR